MADGTGLVGSVERAQPDAPARGVDDDARGGNAALEDCTVEFFSRNTLEPPCPAALPLRDSGAAPGSEG